MALDINKLVTGLSSASDATVPSASQTVSKAAFSLSDLSPPGAPPQSIIRDTPPLEALRFPLDTPMYYMIIQLNSYSRSSWKEVGVMTPGASIVLPIPPQLIDSQYVMYEVVDLGVLGGSILNGVGAISDATKRGVTSSTSNILSEAATNAMGMAARAGLEVGRALGGSGIINGGLLAAGYAVNDYLTVMLRGPSYKKHQFTWKCTPRNASESEMLRKIYVALNDAAAPGLATMTGSAFFTYPDIAKISFKYGDGSRNISDTLFYFKPCVIENVTFSFAPNGSPGFYAASKAPESVEIRLNFMELELWLKGDYAKVQSFQGVGSSPF